ncbi:MAG: TonB-dependent receptor [Luteolibacter sp.]
MKFRTPLPPLACLMAMALPTTGHAQNSPATSYRFAIETTSLNQALQKFSATTGIDVAARSELVRGKTSPALHGDFQPSQALDRLLGGSGLTYHFTNSGTVAIQPASGAPSSENSQPDGHESLPELVVSAASLQKQAQTGALGSLPVLDTPFSISVVDRESIEKRKPKTVAEVFADDPSVTTLTNSYAGGWRERLQVRGFGLNWNSYRLNGLPIETTTSEWPLEIMEQVELLKGPNGFMYGFGVPGGMVNFQTKKPLGTDYASTTLAWTSESAFTASADVSRREGKDGWFGYRVNLGQETGSTYNGADIDRFFGSIAIDARLREDLTFSAEVIHTDRDLENEAPIIGFNYSPSVITSVTGLPRTIDNSEERSIDGTFDRVTNTAATTSLAYDINPDWKTKATYNFYRGRNDINKIWYALLNQAGDYNIYDYQLSWDETDSHYFESLTEGKFDTGIFKHQAVVGASWHYQRSYHTSYTWKKIGEGNLYTGNTYVDPFPSHSTKSYLGSELTRTSAFASDTVEIVKNLSALVGLRFNHYRLESESSDDIYKEDAVTPTYALIYKPRRDVTVYGSYVEALEKGSSVGASDWSTGLPYTNAGQVMDPTISEQLEFGAKYEGERWAASAALFRFERGSNIVKNNGDGTVTLTQDGIDLYQGIEATGSVKITDDFTLTLGGIWLDATYDQLSDTSAAIEGNRIAGTSRYQAILQASYKVPAIEGLEFHIGGRYYGDCYYNNANTLKFPDYTLFNAGFGYSTRIYNHPVTFQGEIKNLTDKEYWYYGGAGEPRVFALSMKTEW